MLKCVNECVRLAPSWRMLNRYVARYCKSLQQRTSSSVGLALKKKKHSTRVKLQRAANLMACVAARLCNFHIPHQPTSELDCIGLSSCTFCYTLYKQGRQHIPSNIGQPGMEYLIAPPPTKFVIVVFIIVNSVLTVHVIWRNCWCKNASKFACYDSKFFRVYAPDPHVGEGLWPQTPRHSGAACLPRLARGLNHTRHTRVTPMFVSRWHHCITSDAAYQVNYSDNFTNCILKQLIRPSK